MITTEYTLVISSSAHEFTSKINKCLDDGWVCQGGIAVADEHSGYDPDLGRDTAETYYYQALIRTTIR